MPHVLINFSFPVSASFHLERKMLLFVLSERRVNALCVLGMTFDNFACNQVYYHHGLWCNKIHSCTVICRWSSGWACSNLWIGCCEVSYFLAPNLGVNLTSKHVTPTTFYLPIANNYGTPIPPRHCLMECQNVFKSEVINMVMWWPTDGITCQCNDDKTAEKAFSHWKDCTRCLIENSCTKIDYETTSLNRSSSYNDVQC